MLALLTLLASIANSQGIVNSASVSNAPPSALVAADTYTAAAVNASHVFTDTITASVSPNVTVTSNVYVNGALQVGATFFAQGSQVWTNNVPFTVVGSSLTVLGTGGSTAIFALKSLASSNPTDDLNFLNSAGTVIWQIGANSAVSGSALEFNNGDGAANRMLLTTAGNLGIGTTSPTTKLHMSSGTLTVDGAAGTLKLGDGTNAGTLTVTGTGTVTGQLAVGLASASFPLHVQGVSGSWASIMTDGTRQIGTFFNGDTNSGIGSRTNIDVNVILNNSATHIFKAGGNVGINNLSPGTKLHLSSGVFTVDGTSGGVRVSSGNTTGALVSGWLSATATFNPGTITGATCTDSAAITVNGAADGNECYVGKANANASVAGVIHDCYVSGDNAVKIRACCVTAGNCVTTSQTYRVTTFLH